MSVIKASQAIKSNWDQSTYLFIGNQIALFDQCRQSWLLSLKKQQPSIEIIQISLQKQDDLEQLRQQALAYGLFSQAKLIQITVDTSTFKKHDQLLSILQQCPKETYMLTSMPKFDFKQKKNKWFKAYEQSLNVIECMEPSGPDRTFWIKRSLKQHRLELSTMQQQWLNDATHGNLSSAIQEIQKLALLVNAGKIDDLVMRQALSQSSMYTPFELIDAIQSGQGEKSIAIANDLLTPESIPLVAWALNQEVRLLLALKIATMQNKPSSVIFKQYRVWGNQQTKVAKRAQQCSLQRLQDLFCLTVRLDQQFKGAPGSAKATALTLIAELCSSEATPATKLLITH